jgi:hypothetical protein
VPVGVLTRVNVPTTTLAGSFATRSWASGESTMSSSTRRLGGGTDIESWGIKSAKALTSSGVPARASSTETIRPSTSTLVGHAGLGVEAGSMAMRLLSSTDHPPPASLDSGNASGDASPEAQGLTTPPAIRRRPHPHHPTLPAGHCPTPQPTQRAGELPTERPPGEWSSANGPWEPGRARRRVNTRRRVRDSGLLRSRIARSTFGELDRRGPDLPGEGL